MIQIPRCPDCHAVIPLDAEACPICHPPPPVPLRLEARQEKYPAPSLATFSVGSLLLLITLIGIGLGAFSISPLLGTFLLLLFPPALVRTLLQLRFQKQRFGSLEIEEKVLTFVYSLLVIVAIGSAMLVSFVFAFFLCLYLGVALTGVAVGPLDKFVLVAGLLLGLLSGALAALACGYVMWQWLFPIRSP